MAEATAEPTSQLTPLRNKSQQFTSEERLEAEIEACMNKGQHCFDMPLKVYDSPEGYGRQYIIPEVGRIDLLTVHADTKDFYVVELKKGVGDDEIVGQVSRYMGWIKDKLATDGQNVYGIICTAQASERLKYAVKANPSVSLYNYEVSFKRV